MIAHMTKYLCVVKPSKLKIMNQSIVFTPNVLNTLRSLPLEERLSITSALAGELLLGAGESTDLEPSENLVYQILRGYVLRASKAYTARH